MSNLYFSVKLTVGEVADPEFDALAFPQTGRLPKSVNTEQVDHMMRKQCYCYSKLTLLHFPVEERVLLAQETIQLTSFFKKWVRILL